VSLALKKKNILTGMKGMKGMGKIKVLFIGLLTVLIPFIPAKSAL